MTRTDERWHFWILRTWWCCGLRWELLLSKRYPERYKYKGPTCPRCGATYDSPV